MLSDARIGTGQFHNSYLARSVHDGIVGVVLGIVIHNVTEALIVPENLSYWLCFFSFSYLAIRPESISEEPSQKLS